MPSPLLTCDVEVQVFAAAWGRLKRGRPELVSRGLTHTGSAAPQISGKEATTSRMNNTHRTYHVRADGRFRRYISGTSGVGAMQTAEKRPRNPLI